MQSLLSFIGGAGAVSLIGVLATWLEYEQGHSQHQKDVTVNEIRAVRHRLISINKQMIKDLNNNGDTDFDELKAISYLASWSVNLVYHRVDKQMVIYSLSPTIKLEYTILKKHLQHPSRDKLFAKSICEINRLFEICGIIK